MHMVYPLMKCKAVTLLHIQRFMYCDTLNLYDMWITGIENSTFHVYQTFFNDMYT